MAFTEVLNLEKIFVNYFFGSLELFTFGALILFSFLAAKYRMPNYIFLMMLSIFFIFMAGFGFQTLYLLTLLSLYLCPWA